MEQLLTVIVQTSPIPSHPSTALLEALFRSFQLVDGLLESRIFIVCDGCEEALPGEKENNKHGKASEETAYNYGLHLERVQECVSGQKPPFVPQEQGTIELLKLPKRHGSARAIEATFVQYDKVKTPFVMICQHDNFFIQKVPLRSCLQMMLQRPPTLEQIGLKCLHFMATATLDYKEKVQKRYNIDIEEFQLENVRNEDGDCCKLIPLVFWYGRTHVAFTEYYTNWVLARSLKTGDHLEELLGVKELEDIRTQGMQVHSKYGNFVLDQGVGEIIYHLSGRRVRAASSPVSLSPEDPQTATSCIDNITAESNRDKETDATDETSTSFTHARSCRAIVPGLEVIGGPHQSKSPKQKRFKQKCFHCGQKGHSYKFCPHLKELPSTETIDLS